MSTPPPGSTTPDAPAEQDAKRSILASSAVMAVGTTFSRFSGFIRAALLVAAGMTSDGQRAGCAACGDCGVLKTAGA